jgi:uncharacterized protein YndB with AHSA1/START domain
MSVSALARKMHLKPGYRARLLNAPDGYDRLLQPLPEGVELLGAKAKDVDWVFLFVHDRKELKRHAAGAVQSLKPEGVFWIAYPKKTSKITTDLTRDEGWSVMTDAGMEVCSLVAVDATWAGVRFRRKSTGARAANERTDGYSVSRSKTVDVSAERVFAAWQDVKTRGRFLPDNGIVIHKATPHKSLRITWVDGRKVVDAALYPKGKDRCQVVVQHNQLADAKMAERMKTYWEACLLRMKEVLEA